MLTLVKKIIVYPLIVMLSLISVRSMASCEVNVLQEFDDGVIAQVEMINDTGIVIEDWSAQLVLLNGYVESIWGDGVYSETGSGNVTISPASWEGPVGIEESRVFYFKASTLDGTAVVGPFVSSNICALPVPVKGFTVSDFTASYYHEDDGQILGQGTDGFDPNITETLITQEIVDEIHIDHISSDFLNINAYNLFVSWEGTISVFDDTNPVTVNISKLFGNANVFIDGELNEIHLYALSDTLTLTLPKGEHDIKIDFHSHFDLPFFSVDFD